MPNISEDAATDSAHVTNVHDPKKQKAAHDVDEDMQNADLGEANESRVENVVPQVENMEHQNRTDDDNSYANTFAHDIDQADEFDLGDDRAFQQWMQSICLHCLYQGELIGHAFGRHINRGMIRHDFYRVMEEPCQDISDVAFEVFDRYGSLKKEFKDHSVRKASGAWSSELDEGNLLLIVTVSADKSWRRKCIAAFMVEAVMTRAKGRRPSKYSALGMAFTLTISACLNGVIDDESKGMSLKDRRAVRGAHCDASTAFFRSIGFHRGGARSPRVSRFS
ncbi:hypothetical protein BP5796_11289 [Coleophoma crateriformis]|uniref:Uncharacterized protein n=1 Tax=Coleophoma crateriformis TaxID=565419 RepID=A0A3D8QI32_9HELO|nr:hypothetical protein BP5796_11289 [Coleophoma crateriformis]